MPLLLRTCGQAMAQRKKRQQQQLKSVFPRKCTMLNLNQNIKSGLDNPKKKRVCILLNYACLLLSSQFSIVSPLNSVGDDCPPPPLFSLPPPPSYGNKFWLVPRPSNFSPFVYTSDRKKSLVHIAWELALCEVDHQILKAPYNGCSCGPLPKVICRRGIFFA